MSKIKVTTIADPDNDNTAITVSNTGAVTVAQNATFSGSVTASSFSGDGSSLTGLSAGVDEVHYWYKNSDFSCSTTQSKISGWSSFVASSSGSNTMSESSGDWTFPTTGVWLVMLNIQYNYATATCLVTGSIHTSDGTERTFGSTTVTSASTQNSSHSNTVYVHSVSNTSTDTLSFQTVTSTGTATGVGGSFRPRTNVVFIKLRD